ncbi:MAG: chemotaxis protein CheW [Bdellovibrionales bacterium]|nr:chemotaxis protein CheW [Bdellovibrionales bacterium]
MNSFKISSFYIDNYLFGLNVGHIQEIIKSPKITPIPSSSDYICGLINLRGQILSCIDLRSMMALDNYSESKSMSVIVDSEDVLISVLVDDVSEILEINDYDYEQTPDNISNNISRFLHGVYQLNSGILLELDINKILKFIENYEIKNSFNNNMRGA